MSQVSVDLPSTQEGRRHSNASFSSVEGFEEFEKEERLSGGSGKEHSEHGKAPKSERSLIVRRLAVCEAIVIMQKTVGCRMISTSDEVTQRLHQTLLI